MREDKILNAMNFIDSNLEGGHKYCFFPHVLTNDERNEVVKRVINNKWVSDLDSFGAKDRKQTEGVLFVWTDDKEELKKCFEIE